LDDFMKIRAVTAFIQLQTAAYETTFAHIGNFLSAATDAFMLAGIVVQSRRVATQPFPQLSDAASIPELAAQLSGEGKANGIDYLSLGPTTAQDDLAYVDAIPAIFRIASGVFASVEIANRATGIDLNLLRRIARLIREVSTITPNGLGNLYLAGLANCGPGSPFFPAAYHGGGAPRFALAIEAADLAIQAFDGALSPDEARQTLTHLIEDAARQLCTVAEKLSAEHGVTFGGHDFSLAPYPGESMSLGAGMERLGATVGGAGMVAAASLVMNAIEAADFPRCGFSGLMLPVLEDTILGRRAAEGMLSVNDLLLYSAVCGTGLDCIPLPGDVSEEVLTGILLDVAALSLRLDKPLTARLMPMPGKAAGDEVTFDFEYFVPSRVMTPPVGLSAGAFSSRCPFRISSRR
jgi:uncharacterized protein (UPF0210 family)